MYHLTTGCILSWSNVLQHTVVSLYRYLFGILQASVFPLNREENRKLSSSCTGYERPQLKPNLKLKLPEPKGLNPWKPWKPPWKGWWWPPCWLSGSMGSSPWSNFVLISRNTKKIQTLVSYYSTKFLLLL